MVQSVIKQLQRLYAGIRMEPIIWLAALLSVALLDPGSFGGFSLCPLKNLGVDYCPGCGLGRAVSFLLHGDVSESVHSHVLGIPATLILIFRIFSLLNNPSPRLLADQSTTIQRSSHAKRHATHADT